MFYKLWALKIASTLTIQFYSKPLRSLGFFFPTACKNKYFYLLDVIFTLWRWCTGSKFHHTFNRRRDRRFQRKCSCDYSWYDSVCWMHTWTLSTTGNFHWCFHFVYIPLSGLLVSFPSTIHNVFNPFSCLSPCPQPLRSISPCVLLHLCPGYQSIVLSMSGYCSGQRSNLLEVIITLHRC